MNLEELLKTMLRSFFVITTGIVLSMYVFCRIFYPDVSFDLHDIGGILLLALISDLPYLIFYSGRELSKKQMYLRKSVHLPVLLTIVLLFAHLWGWVELNRMQEVAVLLLLILGVYAIVFAIKRYNERKLADKLNRRLKERYRS